MKAVKFHIGKPPIISGHPDALKFYFEKPPPKDVIDTLEQTDLNPPEYLGRFELDNGQLWDLAKEYNPRGDGFHFIAFFRVGIALEDVFNIMTFLGIEKSDLTWVHPDFDWR